LFVKLVKYHKDFNSPIDFVIIYIKEAHASDGWKFDGPQYSFIPNHKSLKDRLEAIKLMIEIGSINHENGIAIYSDTMDDHTNHLFRGWPERFYVLYDQNIIYQGQKGPAGYSVPSLQYFLKNNILNN
jgi:hypothetical protein